MACMQAILYVRVLRDMKMVPKCFLKNGHIFAQRAGNFMVTHLKLNTVSYSFAWHIHEDRNLLNAANCSPLIASLQQQVETPAAAKPALHWDLWFMAATTCMDMFKKNHTLWLTTEIKKNVNITYSILSEFSYMGLIHRNECMCVLHEKAPLKHNN